MKVFRPLIRSRLLLTLSFFILVSTRSYLYAQGCGYSYSKTITINKDMVSGSAPHFDFPVLISLTDNNLRTVANGGHVTSTNGYDISFLAEDGTQIAHQIERYVATTGQLIAWLRVPKLNTTQNTTIQMIYGNSQILNNPSTTATWNSNYQAVWHLHDDFNDGTSKSNTATNSGSTDITGKIGDGQSFNGTSDRIYRTDATLNGNFPAKSTGSPNEFTISGWMFIDVLNARRPLLTKQGNGTGNDRGFSLMMESDNRLKIELFSGNNGTTDRTEVYSSGTMSASTWYYVTFTYRYVTDGTSEAYLYLNGSLVGSTNTAHGPVFTNARDLDIGRYFWAAGTEYYHDGIIDEVRVSDVVTSADWIATEFANQNSPATFYAVGSESGGTYIPTIPTCGSAYRKTITINASQVAGSGSHTDFPVLISLTDNDLRTVANSGHVQNANGYDIVFTDANLIPLDHQIEAYTATNGRFVAWVRIPSLSTSVNTTIYMLYGNPDVFVDPSTSCVWNSNQTAVWHLHDDFNDATKNGYTATNNGSTDNTSSKIADGQSFNGTHFLEVSGFPNLTTNFTISGWIRTTDNTIAGQRIFCDDVTNTGGYALSLGDPGTGRLRFYARSMSTVSLDIGSNQIANNTWYYVAAVADRTNTDRFIYINGVLAASNTNDTGTWGTDAGNASIGGETNSGESGNRFRGSLDEIRISTTARSANWLLTEYNNQNSPATFYSVGTEVALNISSTGSGDWDQTGIWSSGTVPGLGANVTILDAVDLDDRDVVICNLTIDGSNNINSDLDIQNGHIMEVTEDVIITNNSNNDDLALRIMDAGSKMIVDGDILVTHTSGDDIDIEVANASDSLIVRGDLIIEHDDGDDITLSTGNATSVFLVEGDLTANLNSGIDDLFTMNLNDGHLIVDGILTLSRFNDFGDITIDMTDGNLTADSVVMTTSGGSGTDAVNILVDGTSIFTSNSGMYISQGGGDDFNIYLNNNAGSTGIFQITNDLVIDKSGGDDMNFFSDDDNSMFHVGGDFIINSTGGEQITFQLNNLSTFEIDGDLTWTHSEGQIEEIVLLGAGGDSPTFNVDGNFIHTGTAGSDQFVLDLDGGNFNVGGNLSVNKNTNTGDVLFDFDGGTMTVTGALNLNHIGDGQYFVDMDNTSVINAGSLNAIMTGSSTNEELLIDIDGDSQINITNDAELEANSGNDMEFHLGQNSVGSTAQFNVGGNLLLDHNDAGNMDDIQFIISDDAVATVGGNFTMSCTNLTGAGNFYTRMLNNAQFTVGGNIVFDNAFASGYTEIELNNNALLQIGGNFVRNAAPNNYGLVQSNNTTVTIEYNGSTAQVFADEDGAGTDGIEYELVIINNSFATEPQLTMEAPVTLTNSITFTDGVLQTTAVNLLTVGDNATANSGSVNSYVSGPMAKQGNDNFIFPLGKNGRWARLGISDIQSSNVADVFTSEYFDSGFSEAFWDSLSYAGNTGGLYNTSLIEHWDLSRTGNGQPRVTLYWNDNASSFINDTNDLVVAHYVGGNTWVNEGGTASGTVASGAVTSTNYFTSFSFLTFGSTNPSVNPLPVELLSFDAIPEAQVVRLNWTTLSEINNHYFTVERSSDGFNFEPLTRVKGSDNSRIRKDYTTVDDHPFIGRSYYRLKQTDYNGEFSYSEIKTVYFGKNAPLFVYPNPSDPGVVHFNKTTSGYLFNASGQLLLELNDEQSMETTALHSGVYTFKSLKGEVVRIVIR